MTLRKTIHVIAAFVLGLFASELMRRIVSPSKDLELAAMSEVDAVEPSVPVYADVVVGDEIQSTFETFATLRPWKEVTLFPLEKSIVEKVFVKAGDRVMRGTVLAQMHSGVQELRRKLSEIELNIQRSEYNLVQSLANKNYVSQKEFEQKKLYLEQQELRAQIEKIEGAKSQLRSPIDGIVSQINLKPRDYIDDPQKHLTLIVDPSQLKAEVFLPQEVAGQLNLKSEVIVTRETSGKAENSHAVIDTIEPIVDSKTGTVRTTLTLTNTPESWRPGIYVKTSLVTAKKSNALLVPNNAIVYDAETAYVFRITIDDTVEKVPVMLGINNGEMSEVLVGLNEFDQIVIRGQGSLADASKVKVIPRKE